LSRPEGKAGARRQLAQLGQGGLSRPPFQIGQAAHHVDKRLARQLGHRGERHRQLLPPVQHQAGAAALTVAQAAAGIGKRGLHEQGLGGGCHPRIH